jgi:uncharacterized membrane protein (UPF0127 family)
MTPGLLLAALLMACVASPGGGGKAAAPAPAAPSLFDARRAAVRFPGGRTIAAEIADTPERVQHGYMFRTEVGEGDGMIFIFAPAGEHAFWMKNTLVPLDIIWMDDTFTIVHIQPSTPPCTADPCPLYGPPRKTSYVLEVRAGTAAREGLKTGSHLGVVFPGEGGGA